MNKSGRCGIEHASWLFVHLRCPRWKVERFGPTVKLAKVTPESATDFDAYIPSPVSKARPHNPVVRIYYFKQGCVLGYIMEREQKMLGVIKLGLILAVRGSSARLVAD